MLFFRGTSIEQARQLFGRNFIGAQELSAVAEEFPVKFPKKIPDVLYTLQKLAPLAEDYLLLLGAKAMLDGRPLNLLSLREKYGVDTEASEPCFYNQDWYLKEDFMKTPLENRWYLIKKSVFEDSHAMSPLEIIHQTPDFHFPPAILCAYAFFAWWFHAGGILWKHDFVWCSDTDHNGDRVYVGKYHDVDGVNKNGFSIHRHLALRECYGALNTVGISHFTNPIADSLWTTKY
jgi:hypothetical protein